MCKVIEVDFIKSNAALNNEEDGTKVLKRPQLSLQKYTKEELELIEAYKGLKEFYKEVNKEVWYVDNGKLNVIINN
ncbi:Uncharacterised protein [uncultured Clostridium sp.]|uniref:hypothetical protein n=1 Tax=uncultured Clostridium sp. TaxID=59620 RepID=UPI00082298D4|nr:hypothetical protein [uncultured Clostridium sp.]SCI99360.1 Uncharacterised protein [uncultured Clostridium sp.]